MSFLLVCKPIGCRGELLGESIERIVFVEDVMRTIIMVFDPSNFTQNGRQVRLQTLHESGLSFLYQRKLEYEPFMDEPADVPDLLWWSYDFTVYGSQRGDMMLVRKLIDTYAKAWAHGHGHFGVFVGAAESLGL